MHSLEIPFRSLDIVTVCMTLAVKLRSSLELGYRILNAANYIGVCDSDERRLAQIRISKTAAVLVGFFIFHSLPNVLLLSAVGRKKYSLYGSFHACCLSTRFVETFLFGAVILHVVLAFRKQLGSSVRKNDMLITGSAILGLLLSHLLDFRVKREDTDPLDETVSKTVRRKKLLYSAFVLAVGVHAWRGATRAWLVRLGFTDRAEILFLHKLCRSLILGSFALYHIPIVR